ncbi:MAG: TrmH family RNA methyltransferase [Patescibacteria group bacterium]
MISVALENIRSTYNVGAILRTSSFFGIKQVILIGYSGVVVLPNGKRVLHPKVTKTALGSEKDLEVVFFENSEEFVRYCHNQAKNIISIEQSQNSNSIKNWQPKENDVVVFGNEVDGLSNYLMQNSSALVEIPRLGKHHSLNVTTACGIVLSKLL